MSKVIGLDLGSSSIGYAIRDKEKDEEEQLAKHGVITFDSGMLKGKNGYASPTKDRREARGKRNLIRARKQRKWALLKILIDKKMCPLTQEDLDVWKGRVNTFPENEQFLSWLKCDFSYCGSSNYKNPYELRVQGIEGKLALHEFGRALYHIVQRRGYKDIGEKDKETKKQIERREGEGGLKYALEKNDNILSKALKNDFLDKSKRARNEYPYRDEYKNELEVLCQKQGLNTDKIENKNRDRVYQDDLMHRIWKAIIWQRPLRSQKGNIGKCTLEKNSQRIPTSHPLFEIFRALSFINTIKYNDEIDVKDWTTDEKIRRWHRVKKENGFKELSSEFKKELFLEKFLKKTANFKFESVKSFLDKKLKKRCIYNYPINIKTGKYDTSISDMPFCGGLIGVFSEELEKQVFLDLHKKNNYEQDKIILNKYSIDDIWHLLFDEDEENIKSIFKEIETTTDKEGKEKHPLVELKKTMPKAYGQLGAKALKKIIPFLLEGWLYNDAVILAKLPYICKKWGEDSKEIESIFKQVKEQYKNEKQVTNIVNALIDKWKGLKDEEKYDYSEIAPQQKESFDKECSEGCKSHFGSNRWKELTNEHKTNLIQNVKNTYQSFFKNNDKKYITIGRIQDIFQEALLDKDFIKDGCIKETIDDSTGEIKKDIGLYHHSDMEKYKKVDGKLGNPRIDSIKNPMFNKAMVMLKKVIQFLIDNDDIDERTEVVIEVARELNDNNKRQAIEKYQRERESNRQKYREFIEEFSKEKSWSNQQIEDCIEKFELWTEQNFDTVTNEKGKNEARNVFILKKGEAEDRYKLWEEQKGICFYTGNTISVSQLFSEAVEIEHTIPRSIFPCNERFNKTVAFKCYNTDTKENKLPTGCPNYDKETEEGKAIIHWIKNWEKKRDYYKEKFEKNKKPKGNEDEKKKNERIVNKHYYKMHYDYWRKKVETFTITEVKDSWVRRQLTDTQMITKYARDYLKTYFKKVTVQKGQDTAWFRKIFGIQIEEKKDRTKHTHHSIDAAVLTFIPSNASAREDFLKKAGKYEEENNKIFHANPFNLYSKNTSKTHSLIVQKIEDNTLVYHHKTDNILKQTKKVVRKRGKIQYRKNDKGEKIKMITQGETIRGSVFKKTYLGKIAAVERDENGKPLRNEDGSWKYKKGEQKFKWVERKSIKDANVKAIRGS